MSGADAQFTDRAVLVTGGAGLIGSALVRRLAAEGARVTVLDSMIPLYGGNLFNLQPVRPQIMLDQRDLRDAGAVEAVVRNQDLVFHLAAQTSHLGSMQEPLEDIGINVVGSLHLLEACRRFNPTARVVFTSTRQVYGTPEQLPVTEDHPIRPPDVNGISKHAAERYHLLYERYHGIPCTILRLTNTYGPGMRIRDARQTFVGIWLRKVIEGAPFQVYGDGQQRRDFNFVEDVVDALLLAATRPQAIGRVYNLGAPDAPSLQDIARLLVELVPDAQFEYVPFPEDRRSIDIGNCQSSFVRIQTELGWRPATPLRDGLQQCLEYYRANFSRYLD